MVTIHLYHALLSPICSPLVPLFFRTTHFQLVAASGPPKITPVDPEAPADGADDTAEIDSIPLPDPNDVPRDATDIIDEETLNQIREMDEDDEDEEEGVGSREFSRGIVFGFFEQAEGTFAQMQTAL